VDDVQPADRAADGQILLLGVDGLELPVALTPSGYDVLLQADGPQRWLAIAAAPDDWARMGAEMVRRVPKGTVEFRTQPSAEALAEFVRGWRLAGYRYPAKPAEKVLLLPGAIHQAQVDATLAARDLVNTPSGVKNPAWMVKQARKVAKAAGATIDVLDVKALRAGGFGGVLAVGAGSSTPPRVVILRKPGRGPRIVLVGKGITFDSGGLSIKPREAMILMKTDMAGAAAVLGAVPLIPEGSDVTVLLGLAENAVGATSYKPGDVIEHVGGLTSEVLNTDAEGRLVLADLLAYARMNLQPDVIVDLATLTGAATIALSREMGALYSTSPVLTDALRSAGKEAGEQLWPMPLEPGYREALKSPIADQSHVSVGDVGAGSITAALFLQRFVGDVAWAHLDIAGPARATAAGGLRTYGGTGFGAALLGRWLEQGARF
jgi:leucyl aminopeptidase